MFTKVFHRKKNKCTYINCCKNNKEKKEELFLFQMASLVHYCQMGCGLCILIKKKKKEGKKFFDKRK